MSMPVVAIVGRPNVGKSTLFNKLIGQRVAIVNDTPGVTRDRIYGECEWRSRKITLVDTGGIEPYSDDVILSQMRRQAELAIDTADVIVLVTDVKTGVVATDSEVAAMLLKSGRREQVLAGLKKAFPPLRRLSMRLASSRAASVLAMMLSSGFPLEQALEMVPLVLPDAEAAGEIAKIREKMGEGVSFSDALTGSAMFDEIHRQMLRMGIAAGREDQVMSKIAQTYEQQVEEGLSLIHI